LAQSGRQHRLVLFATDVGRRRRAAGCIVRIRVPADGVAGRLWSRVRCVRPRWSKWAAAAASACTETTHSNQIEHKSTPRRSALDVGCRGSSRGQQNHCVACLNKQTMRSEAVGGWVNRAVRRERAGKAEPWRAPVEADGVLHPGPIRDSTGVCVLVCGETCWANSRSPFLRWQRQSSGPFLEGCRVRRQSRLYLYAVCAVLCGAGMRASSYRARRCFVSLHAPQP
jgi:hypothetical protein